MAKRKAKEQAPDATCDQESHDTKPNPQDLKRTSEPKRSPEAPQISTHSPSLATSAKPKLANNPAKRKRKSRAQDIGSAPLSKSPSTEAIPPLVSQADRADGRPNWAALRPITRLWVLQYMKALLACSKYSEAYSWYNIRALGDSSTTPNAVVEALLRKQVIVKDMVALDLGWIQGEWMVKVDQPGHVTDLSNFDHNFHDGFFMSKKPRKGPPIQFIITPVSPSGLDSRTPVSVPIVLMGIPFYDSELDLGLYLFEAITAQNKNLGIQSVKVKQRYKVGSAQTNDVRCHVTIDPARIHKWDLEKSMKVVLQGWNNEGVPRPEMWPVTIRCIDECSTCGDFYHNGQGESTENNCWVSACSGLLLERRKIRRDEQAQEARMQMSLPEPSALPASVDSGPSTTGRTSIGFIVAT